MIVGITGHQNLGDDRRWVEHELRGQLRDLSPSYGISCLAVGADQVFASILMEMGLPYGVVVPSHDYERTFAAGPDLLHYQRLRASASHVIELSHLQASNEAFWRAGKIVVDLSDRVIAVWNGRPSRGLGGTADIVSFSLRNEVPVLHLNNTMRTVIWLNPG